jgi:transcription elongation factor GreA-like protein
MIIKRGIVVSHAGAMEWGVGKVMEVNDLKATIQFSDGIIRKIASSHYTILHPADSASFVSPADSTPVPKVRAVAKRVKKVKTAEA